MRQYGIIEADLTVREVSDGEAAEYYQTQAAVPFLDREDYIREPPTPDAPAIDLSSIPTAALEAELARRAEK